MHIAERRREREFGLHFLVCTRGFAGLSTLKYTADVSVTAAGDLCRLSMLPWPILSLRKQDYLETGRGDFGRGQWLRVCSSPGSPSVPSNLGILLSLPLHCTVTIHKERAEGSSRRGSSLGPWSLTQASTTWDAPRQSPQVNELNLP